ncbi:MAG TPA: phosphopentomutase [Candidatus Acidoferrum sp.]|nr:phosphopentomutase [Candidatus Acidoferrum sp.]
MSKRVILIVLDSVGCGALPDAAKYGDEGASTLTHVIAAADHKPKLDNLVAMGLSRIEGVDGLPDNPAPTARWGRMAEMSPGKDTTTGHWEIAGIVLAAPFPTFPNGLPASFIEKFEAAIGRKTLCNRATSGTMVIEQFGAEHMRTGYPIVYTSADSVFQIAAHEAVIPPEALYDICRTARRLLTGDVAVGRVIARPFEGVSGSFARTPRRRDFSVEPPADNMLTKLKAAGLEVRGIGKIGDIFAGVGMTLEDHAAGNAACVDATLRHMEECGDGLIFTNLVDFDMLYGHRNNAAGYLAALEYFDARLPEILSAMREGDLLIITADHGCDPTNPSTDHSREHVPLLVYGDGTGEIPTPESFTLVSEIVLGHLLA